MENIKHSSKKVLWYTPLWLVEKCQTVLGGIDFDPTSDAFGNSRVNAKQHLISYGLEQEWPEDASIFLNPPGGKVGLQSQSVLFWKKFCQAKKKHGIFIGFSIEILQTSQVLKKEENKDLSIISKASALCFPKKRIAFDDAEGNKSVPTHANVIVYQSGLINNVNLFIDAFSDIGNCIKLR